jgi:hypothetical protein
MAMNPKLLRPRQTGLHPEAQVWRNAVIANGGTVSGSTLAAVSRFCLAIDAAGIRNRFYRLNLFCGTGLEACLVPLYRGPSLVGTQYGGTTDTNNGPFVSGDYVETGASGGLLGNGSTKYLNTGFSAANLNRSSTHLGVYGTALNDGGASFASLAGARDSSANNLIQLDGKRSGAANTYFSGASNAVSVSGSPVASSGHVLGVSASATDLRVYVAGNSTGSTTTDRTSGTLVAQSVYIFANNFHGSPFDRSGMRCRAYSFGVGMTASQVSAFYNAMQAFQTSLGRNV